MTEVGNLSAAGEWLNACPSLVGLIVLSLQGRLSCCEVEVLEGFAK